MSRAATFFLPNGLIIFGAKYLFLLLPVIALIWFLRLPRREQKVVILIGLVTGLLALGAARVAALFYFDPRPFVTGHFTPLIPHEPDNGFPSDHTLLSGAIAMTVFIRDRRVGGILWGLAILVGAARIASGLHSLVDVAGSIAFTVAAGLIAAAVARRVFPAAS